MGAGDTRPGLKPTNQLTNNQRQNLTSHKGKQFESSVQI